MITSNEWKEFKIKEAISLLTKLKNNMILHADYSSERETLLAYVQDLEYSIKSFEGALNLKCKCGNELTKNHDALTDKFLGYICMKCFRQYPVC